MNLLPTTMYELGDIQRRAAFGDRAAQEHLKWIEAQPDFNSMELPLRRRAPLVSDQHDRDRSQRREASDERRRDRGSRREQEARR